ncbi:MAG: hypothetical protein L3K19_06760 [Thermoplasmata archaeon]|nr:hypothetical protein [Thermoplasmata archaeon]
MTMPVLPFPVPPELAGLLTNPTFGLPFLLTAAVLGVWLYWNPLGAPASLGTRATWSAPDSDPVSKTYYALSGGRVSRVVATAYEQYEASVKTRFGRPLGQLPLTAWGRARTGIARAAELRRLAAQLREAYQQALLWEAPIRIRWAFWRTPQEDRALFEGRVHDRLDATRHMIAWMEQKQ